MPPNNPYIDLVKQDTDIFCDSKEAQTHKGCWNQYFGNKHPIILEIGTGMGNFFSYQIGKNPEKNFIGMEIRYKRCYQSAEKSRKIGGKNFAIIKEFAQKIPELFSQEELSETYIFFPDPWANKDRQKKHRLLQEDFLADLYRLTKPGGKLFFKTDHKEYFDSSREILEKQGLWKTIHWTYDYENSDIFDIKKITEFEGFYRGENTDINYIELEK